MDVQNRDNKDVLIELRESTGMTRREFCDYFGIPYRTLQDQCHSILVREVQNPNLPFPQSYCQQDDKPEPVQVSGHLPLRKELFPCQAS